METDIPELITGIAEFRRLGRRDMTFMLGRRRGLKRVLIEMGRGCRDKDMTMYYHHRTNHSGSSSWVQAEKNLGGRFSV